MVPTGFIHPLYSMNAGVFGDGGSASRGAFNVHQGHSGGALRARDQRDGVRRERALAMKSYRVRNEGDPAGGSSTSRWFATQVDFRTLDDHIIRALGSSSILLCCGDGSELGIGYFWVGGGKFGLLLVST